MEDRKSFGRNLASVWNSVKRPIPMAFLAITLLVVSAVLGLPVFVSTPPRLAVVKPVPHRAMGVGDTEPANVAPPTAQSETLVTGSTIVRNGVTIVSPPLLSDRVVIDENPETDQSGRSNTAVNKGRPRATADSRRSTRTLSGLSRNVPASNFALPARF